MQAGYATPDVVQCCGNRFLSAPESDAPPMFGPTRAPGFDHPGLTWFNVPAPLTLADLRGRVTLLDFWTSGCINCLQILPTLRRIEDVFSDRVTVIGVHSPKFTAEQNPGLVADTIARYGIRHPVVHDPRRILWDQYAVRAWPTLVVITPDGRVIGQMSGEPDPDRMMQGFHDLLATLSGRGQLAPASLPLTVPDPQGGRLCFPGKIRPLPLVAPETNRHWAIADTGHNQIVLTDEDGQELTRFGHGSAGLIDGPAHRARFNAPQGVAADAAALYVADTGNHALRRIDRVTGIVTTVAGTGKRGGPLLFDPKDGERTALASPWDVEIHRGFLIAANAGTHQLVGLDLARGKIRALAGTGGENLVDGPGEEALLAQPSGLYLDATAGHLFFADAESSAIRCLDLKTDTVTTLCGQDLFAFGLRDGPLDQALLQHPLGLCAYDGALMIADTYNGTLRLLDQAHGTLSALEDGTLVCLDPLCRPFRDPAGVWDAGDNRLLVSDSGNHRIVEIDLSRMTSRTWME